MPELVKAQARAHLSLWEHNRLIHFEPSTAATHSAETASALPGAFIQNLQEKQFDGFAGSCFQCEFDPNCYNDTLAATLLGEALPAPLRSAVVKRQAEFVAGRFLARQALLALQAPATTVGIGPQRNPLWPQGFTGALSHSNQRAICLVAHQAQHPVLGIDLETLLSPSVARDIAGSVLVDAEHRLVGGLQAPDPTLLTLIFSAKESLFKALYPQVGAYFDFSAARLVAVDWQSGRFTLELLQELTPALGKQRQFCGRFYLQHDQVLTLITG